MITYTESMKGQATGMNNDIEVKSEEMSFEAALARLEQIVKSLEDGSAPLDSSLELFEEGVKLVRSCNSKLDAARRRVTILSENGEETEMEDMHNG